jgi:hypothetical protein
MTRAYNISGSALLHFWVEIWVEIAIVRNL